MTTTDEANRLATGLTGAAAAERDGDVLPPRLEPWERTYVGSVNVHLKTDAVARTTAGRGPFADEGHADIGPVFLYGEWDVLEATLVAALEAVRVARTGPVGA